MTKSLHNKYPEYNRIKYKVFTSQVQVAFERAVQRLMEEAGQPEAGDDKDEEEEKNNKKKEKEKAEKARIEKENKANGKSMTNTMNELYKKKDQKEVVEIKMKKDPIMIIDTKGDEKLARERDEKLARQNKKEDPKSSKPVTAAALAKPVEIDLTGRGSSAAKILSEKAIIKSTPLRSDSTKSSRAPSPTMERTPMKRASAKGMIPVVVPKTTFADVGGCEAKLREIHRLTRHLRWPNFYREVGVLPPRGCLLHGPPGCGKTLLANAIAGERSLPILTMAATEFVSGVTGDSERKIRDLFDQAKGAAPCILFIDDVDVIAKRRADAQKDMEMRMVSQLISCLDELNAIGFESEGRVFVIGATSRLESIDPALRTGRRMGREIALGIPDVKARTHILEVLCRDTALAPGLDLQHLARLTPGYVGSDLDSLIAEAASLVDDKMCKEAAKASGGGENSREDDVIRWLQESPGAREKLPKAEISLADFEVAIKTVRPSSLTEGFATVPNVSFDDIGALDDIREELELAVCAPVNFPEMVQSLGLDTPSGVLLCGPPGCGKTLLAKAVANQAGINFISVKGPEIMNKVRSKQILSFIKLFSDDCQLFLVRGRKRARRAHNLPTRAQLCPVRHLFRRDRRHLPSPLDQRQRQRFQPRCQPAPH
jgi:ribosome biogenesis ATPase